MRVSNIQLVYIAAGEDGRIHRGFRDGHGDTVFTAEADNLDSATSREEVSLEEALKRVVDGAPLCERCFPSGMVEDDETSELSHTADAGRAGEA